MALACPAREAPGLRPGPYVGVVQEWRFGRTGEIRLAHALAALTDGEPLDGHLADQVLRRAVPAGRTWVEAREAVDLAAATSLAEALTDELHGRFDEEGERKATEIADRIAIQVATLERGAAEDRARIERTIALAGPSLEAANRARLARLEERLAQRRLAIEGQGGGVPESRDVAVILLNLEA